MSEENKPHWLEDDEVQKLGEREDQESQEGDSVMRYTTGWVFWDETWSSAFGIFQDEREARIARLRSDLATAQREVEQLKTDCTVREYALYKVRELLPDSEASRIAGHALTVGAHHEYRDAQRVVKVAEEWQVKEHKTLDRSETAMRERWHREMVKVLDAILAGRGPEGDGR